MRRYRQIYAGVLTALCLLTACGTDQADEQGGDPASNGGRIRIRLSVTTPEGVSGTRAWKDANAADAEMMNVWTVVAVNKADNKVAAIYACKPSGDPDQEMDEWAYLPAEGTYRFYSFANMSPKTVMSLLGIGGTGEASKRASTRDAGRVYDTTPATGGSDNENTALGTVSSNVPNAAANDSFFSNDNDYPKNTFFDIAFNAGHTVDPATVEAVTVNMAGNNFDVNTADNGFGAKGIPMSNVQEKTVAGNADVVLVVIRMLAKIELWLYNDKGSNVSVTSFTLTDITKNEDHNLRLLPKLIAGANTMNPVHSDIEPNLGSDNVTQGDMTLYPTGGVTVSATDNSSDKEPVKLTFYVNESAAPRVSTKNLFSHYFLKIKLSDESEQRYALIDDVNETGYAGSWNYIARNDYRIIPVVLDDYKLDIIPYDFTAIGIYPASVKEEDGVYTINFHDYGHFHLLPQVTKVSDATAVVPFTSSAPAAPYASTVWGLVGDSFATSWGSWTDAAKGTPYDNATASPAFYRTGTDAKVTTTTDGDEVGGVPVWYANTSAPQWKPTASSDYQPFIFGYIADPGEAVTTDRKVYHEFSVNLYKQGSSMPRQMTYRLYMILDTDQLHYARRSGSRPVCRSHGVAY